MTPESPTGNGLGEVGQEEIEKRAWDFARADHRDTLEPSDLEEARRQILGPSASTESVSKTEADETR